MRVLGTLALLLLAAFTEASVSRVDSRTFAIESGGIPGGSEGPNRPLAERVCPGGYRVVDKLFITNRLTEPPRSPEFLPIGR